MPWTQQNGGSSGDSGGPWGRPPSGGPGDAGNPGGGQGPRSTPPGGPPDLEDLLRRVRQAWQRLSSKRDGGLNGPMLALAGLVIVVLWLLSGIYSVGADEQGVVLRFGKFVARTAPGINYHLPWPIETVETPKVTVEHQINIGSGENGDLPSESLMLTGDENIVDINFTVYWVIKDAAAYLFNVQNPDRTIKAVAESAMREIVGETALEPILTEDREPIQVAVRRLMQKTLDSYGAGVTITRVQLQKADPPAQVIAAYRDVQAARADQEGMRNSGETYANQVIPEARGRAAQIVQNALAYKQKAIAEATGEANRFLSVLAAYRLEPQVTRQRMYLETMSGIFAHTPKIVIDPSAARTGVVPYLPLPELKSHPVPMHGTVSVTEGPTAALPQKADGQ